MKTEDIMTLTEKHKEACTKRDAASLLLAEANLQIESVERQLFALSTPNSHLKRLTNQEHKIYTLLQNRLTNKEIANQLYISERTVKFHVSHILAKLAIRSRMDLF